MLVAVVAGLELSSRRLASPQLRRGRHRVFPPRTREHENIRVMLVTYWRRLVKQDFAAVLLTYDMSGRIDK